MRRGESAFAFVALALVTAAAGANGGEPAGEAALGRKVFTAIAQPSCSLCHVLEAAGATGRIGPSLDELKPDAKRAELAVRRGVGVMPPYEGKLTEAQIRAVASYVSQTAGR